jgi:hypothetical protein
MVRIGLLAIVAALAFSACGDDPAPVAEETPAPKVALHPVINEPLNGGTITAETKENATLTAEVQVRGLAEPDTRVVVSSGCKFDACVVKLRTTEDGSFETTVRLSTDVEQPRGTIVLGYENGAVSYDTDRVVLTVEPPAVALPTDQPKKKKRKKAKGRTSRAKQSPRATSTPTAAPESEPTPVPPTRSTTTDARNLVVIGDSLAEGMKPYLSGFLSGWDVSIDARIGRPLAEGMRLFTAAPKPSRPTVYAFSLFTNDGPGSVSALEAAVRQSTSRGSCVVWSTIVRPPVGGKSYDAANAKLSSLAASSGGRIRLVQWAEQVARNQSWIAGDGVHATPTGYRNRAALYAAAAKTCAG